MNNRVVIIYICERIQSIQINTFSYNSAYKNIYTSSSSKRGGPVRWDLSGPTGKVLRH